jgi:hypothetical protein
MAERFCTERKLSAGRAEVDRACWRGARLSSSAVMARRAECHSSQIRFLLQRLCHASAGTNVALALGLARCHDTDDTNRGSGDTRKIRWVVKMERSGTFQMYWVLERCLAIAMAAPDYADRASSVVI